jgi:hypothetical protein
MNNQITNVITTSVTIPLDFQSNSMAWTVGTAESPKVRWRTDWKAVKHCKKRSKKLSRTPRMPSATKTRPNKDVLESVVTKTLDSTKGLMEDAGHYGFNLKNYKETIRNFLKNQITLL